MPRNQNSKEWSTQDMINNSDSWSLAGDIALLNYLKSFSNNLFSETIAISSKIDNLLNNVDTTAVRLDLIKNEFNGLRSRQFIEKRVVDEEEPLKQHNEVTNNSDENNEETEEEKVSAITNAINKGLSVLNKYYDKVDINLSDTEDDEENDKSYILQPKDLFADRILPYLVGSNEWNKNWHVGLLEQSESDESEGEQENKKPAENDVYSSSSSTNSESFASEELESNNSEHPISIKTTKIIESETCSTTHSNNNNNNIEVKADSLEEVPKQNQKTDTMDDFAAQLAAKLNIVVANSNLDNINKNPIRKIGTDQPAANLIFSDEPPPLFDDDDHLIEDDLFTRTHRNQFQWNEEENVKKKGLFDFSDDDDDDDDKDDISTLINKRTKQMNENNSKPFLSEYKNVVAPLVDERPPEIDDKTIVDVKNDDVLIKTNEKEEMKSKYSTISTTRNLFDDDDDDDDELFSTSSSKQSKETNRNEPIENRLKSKSLFDDFSDDDLSSDRPPITEEDATTKLLNFKKKMTLFQEENDDDDDDIFNFKSNLDLNNKKNNNAQSAKLFNIPPSIQTSPPPPPIPAAAAADDDDRLSVTLEKNNNDSIFANKPTELFGNQIDKTMKIDDDNANNNNNNNRMEEAVERNDSQKSNQDDGSAKDNQNGRDDRKDIKLNIKDTVKLYQKKLNETDEEIKEKTPSPIKLSPGKLRHNLNINVGALLPGAALPKLRRFTVSTDDDDDDDVDTSGGGGDDLIKSFSSVTLMPPISSNQPSENRNSSDSLDLDRPDHTHILHSVTKDRVKIPIKRRPSTRKARIAAVRKSLAESDISSLIESATVIHQKDETAATQQERTALIKSQIINPVKYHAAAAAAAPHAVVDTKFLLKKQDDLLVAEPLKIIEPAVVDAAAPLNSAIKKETKKLNVFDDDESSSDDELFLTRSHKPRSPSPPKALARKQQSQITKTSSLFSDSSENSSDNDLFASMTRSKSMNLTTTKNRTSLFNDDSSDNGDDDDLFGGYKKMSSHVKEEVKTEINKRTIEEKKIKSISGHGTDFDPLSAL